MLARGMLFAHLCDLLGFDLGLGPVPSQDGRGSGAAGFIVEGCDVRLPLPRLLPDLLAALFVAALIEVDVWRRSGVLGTHIAGPRWLTAALPLLLAVPLLWRRRFPAARLDADSRRGRSASACQRRCV